MTEKHPKSKLKRKRSSVDECRAEISHKSLLQKNNITPDRNDRTAATERGSWWSSANLSAEENLWALTVRCVLPYGPVPDLPEPSTPRPTSKEPDQWKWCGLDEEVPPFPEEVPPSTEPSPCPQPLPSQDPFSPNPSPPQELQTRAHMVPIGDPCGSVASARGWGGDGPAEKTTYASSVLPSPSSHTASGKTGQRAPANKPPLSRKESQPSIQGWARGSLSGSRSVAGGVGEEAMGSGATRRQPPPAHHSKTSGASRSPPQKEGLNKERGVGGEAGVSGIEGGGGGGGGDAKGGEEERGGGRTMQSCPMCLLVFPAGFTQMDCDGHLAQCLSEMNVDMSW